jgi:hypothetical protein
MNNPFDGKDGRRRFSIPLIIALSLGGFVLAAALALFFGLVVMLLWNWLMPAIFKLPTIDYWQGWGLVLLSHILIKPGFGGHGRPGHGFGGGRHGRDWKHHLGHHLRAGEKAGEPPVTEV